MLEKLFRLQEHHTDARTEVMAGLTTFMTMAYILAVNPAILGQCGMDRYAVMIATALASCAGSLFMAFLANYPFALAPGMGLNATFTYGICLTMGMTWQMGLLIVLIEGIVFILLSLTSVREMIFNAIPLSLKYAVSAGIGLFIAFIGFQNSGFVVNNDSTLVSMVNFKANFSGGGLTALLTCFGVLVMGILLAKKVKGAVLIGILATWVLGMVLELAGVFTPAVSCFPYFDGFHLEALGLTFGQCFFVDISGANFINFLTAVFTLLFVDVFDTLGGIIGISSQAGFLDKEGRLPRIKGALLADALATTVGAVFGTSTTTTYAESAAGVEEGGKTGLTAAVTGLLFLVAVFLAPIFTAIPSFATAPALIIVGVYMVGSIKKIHFEDFVEGIPAFLCIVLMPFCYSISEGIFVGFIAYTLLSLLTGRAKEKKVSGLMYVLSALFILKYILL